MRVGGSLPLTLDVRLIAATNRELTQAVEQQKFRTDLYYRLKVVTLVMPPLRERTEDIPLLVWHFLARFAEEHQRPVLMSLALQALVRYSWPGNVRELKNLIENLVIFSKQPVLQLPDLPPEVRQQPATVSAKDSQLPARFEELNMSTIEKQAILQALEKTSGNRLRAAQLLGIGLRTLQTKLKEYGMTER
jgi:DNA-binding NtrC family response regulator